MQEASSAVFLLNMFELQRNCLKHHLNFVWQNHAQIVLQETTETEKGSMVVSESSPFAATDISSSKSQGCFQCFRTC